MGSVQCFSTNSARVHYFDVLYSVTNYVLYIVCYLLMCGMCCVMCWVRTTNQTLEEPAQDAVVLDVFVVLLDVQDHRTDELDDGDDQRAES